MYRILIVEDDPGIAGAIATQLEMWNMQACVAQDFRNIAREAQSCAPHLILMDVGLPFYDGYHWCSEIRKSSNVPILFISSASDNMNIVMAMNMGADDFIAKPFDMNVLIAKVQALMRRSYDYAASAPVLEHRGALLNTGDGSLFYRDQQIELSKNEYRILLTLLRSKGKVVSREKLMEQLWSTDCFVDENTLSVNVGRLRRKLEAAGLNGFITTKFGAGYIIQDAPEGGNP